MRLQPGPFPLALTSPGQWEVGADGGGKAVGGFPLPLPWVLGSSLGRDPL